MTLDRLDVLARGWRGPLFAALVALVAGLPGLLALPVLDRDEARFAQSTAQMLESGDLVDVRFQEQDRSREPILPHWLQAASVKIVSSPEARRIWAYRLPSLAGAMLAAAACAWGATRFFGAGTGALAGAILGGCLMLSIEAGIAKADALLCGVLTLALAALGRLYGEARGTGPAGAAARPLFWLGLAASVLTKGPVGPLTIVVTVATLWACDRGAPWLRRIGWTWGLILVFALVGPWLAAVTVRTDGLAWTRTLSADLAGVGPSGRAPPGLYVLAAPLLLFPFTALLPGALVEGWKAREAAGPRFALCWLIPNLLLLEASPSRLIHQALPLYGAVAWLAAYAARRSLGRWTRLAGALLSLAAAVAIAAGAGILAHRYGGAGAGVWAGVAALLLVAAGACGAMMLAPIVRAPALAGALAAGVAAHGALAAGLAPRLKPLWLSQNLVAALDQAGLNPRNGLAPGPVTVAGFAAPSLVFALGDETELGDADDAAQAIMDSRPAVVAQSLAPAFEAALADAHLTAIRVGAVNGIDYVDGQAVALNIFRSENPPQPLAHGGRSPAGPAAPTPAPGPRTQQRPKSRR